MVVFYGGPLESPVVMTKAGDIALLVGEVAAARPTRPVEKTNQPFVRVALFWDTDVFSKMRGGQLLDGFRVTDADQFGKVFLAGKQAPPAIDLPWYGQWPRELSPTARQLLGHYGVPMSSSSPAGSNWRLTRIAVGFGSAAALVMLVMLGVMVLRKLLRVRSAS